MTRAVKTDKGSINKEITATKTLNTMYKLMYVSQEVNNKKLAARYYDNLVTKLIKSLHVDITGLELPKIVIVSAKESSKTTIAGFDGKTNKIYVRADLASISKTIDFQRQYGDNILAYSNRAESSLLHELGHWYQYQKTKKENPGFNNSEIRIKNKENSYKLIANFNKNGYNIDRDISFYALKNSRENPEEVYAEYFVKKYFER